MSNTITLPRADWEMLESVIARFIMDYHLGNGSLQLVLDNISSQLDNQEY